MGAASTYKPYQKSEYSSQGTLINQVFPEEVLKILHYIEMMETKEIEAIAGLISAISWFAANIPPFKRYFHDYEKIKEQLESCRKEYKQWQTDDPKGRNFPILLKEKIYALYEAWWEAYNDSGAGIRGTIYIPREQRVADAIRNL